MEIDDNAGSVEDQSQNEAEDDVVPQKFVSLDTANIEIVAN